MATRGRKPSRKTEDDKIIEGANDSLLGELRGAIWDAAGKFASNKKSNTNKAAELLPDELIWKYDRVLSFQDFCASPEHMNFPPLSTRQMRVAEFMFGDDPKKMFDINRNTSVLCWGKGSGKDTLSVLMICYVIYILLCLKNPQQFLGSANHDSIDLLNVAACVTMDTLVKVAGGWKPVADIVNGDMIATWDGRHQPVSKLFKFDKKPVFSVMLKNGMRVRCTDNHRFKVLRDAKWEEVKLKDLSEGDILWYGQGLSFGSSEYVSRIKHEKRTSSKPLFGGEMRVTNDIAYMLGLVVSDGYLSKERATGGRYVGWVVPEHQPEISAEVERIGIESFSGRMKKSVQKADVPRGPFNVTEDLYNYKVCSRDFWDHAVSLGMKSGGKKGHKGFPWKMLSGSRDSVRHLLAGMFDGDGSFSREIKYYSVSEEIIGWAAMALNGLGISTDVWFGNGIFNLTIPNSEVDKFLNEVPIRRNVVGRCMDRRTGPSEARKLHGVMDMVKADCGIVGRYSKDGQMSCLVDTILAPASGTMTEGLLRSRVYSSPIFSIHPDGVEDVFDYEALPDKEMIANGVMSIDSKEQAQTVFFQNFKTRVLHWNWLKTQWDIQSSGRFFSSSQKDATDAAENKVIITNDAILFPSNVRAFSGSCEAETLEGKNLLFWVLDEVDAFKADSKIRSAEKIYRTLRTSAVSRFGNKFKGFVISYPRSSTGFILKMYESTKKFLNIYGDIAATWEVKPRELFSKQTFEFEGHEIPMDFYEDFRLDPIGAKRAYLCIAPAAETPYLEDVSRVDAAISDRQPLFSFRDEIKGLYVRKQVTQAPYMHDRSIEYTMLLDLGIKKDSTALTLMHRNQDKIIVDFSTVWVPNPNEGIVVDLENVEKIIQDVRNAVNVKDFYADHWNSPMFVQKLRNKGVKAEIIKLKFEDYQAFKRLLYSGNIQLIRHTRLIHEIKNLQLYSGNSVDHAPDEHNDMAVTIVMGTKVLLTVGKGEMSSNMAAEGEYVGENIGQSIDVFSESDDFPTDWGVMIDGIPFG